MILLVGSVIVVVCTLGGYSALGGKLGVLWQPFEVVIICGAALGGYIISNPTNVLRRTLGAIKLSMRGSGTRKATYLELLSLLYQVLKLAKQKGNLALETHIEKPDESQLFQQFPQIAQNQRVMTFLCDHLRLITMGSEDPHEMEALMDEEIETVSHENHKVSGAIQTVADGLPALGIVAAVLGVIKTMGAITEPPEVLGKLIGGALVGTFLGVWLSYGFVGPIGRKAEQMYEDEEKFLHCIKSALLAHMNGSAPAVSVEFARKVLYADQRPTFYEVEDAVGALPPVA
jgi:chemotaxis protein MotA